jgi:hypothetical protein
MGLLEQIEIETKNMVEARVDAVRESKEYTNSTHRMVERWMARLEAFEIVCRVFHENGINVSKTQVERHFSWKPHEECTEVIKKCEDEMVEDNPSNLLGRSAKFFIQHLESEEQCERHRNDPSYPNQPDIKTQLTRLIEDRERMESRIRKFELSTTELREVKAELSECEDRIYELKFKVNEMQELMNKGAEELAAIDQEIIELTYAAEKHQGTVIRPPKKTSQTRRKTEHDWKRPDRGRQ